ncbi:hypothetical protein SNEBB_000096 [Seison nebaliae]|nr:hypothetical protein SNEBB_000096 [Seison nebaliae]
MEDNQESNNEKVVDVSPSQNGSGEPVEVEEHAVQEQEQQQEQQPPQQPGFGDTFKQLIKRIIFFYIISSVIKMIGGTFKAFYEKPDPSMPILSNDFSLYQKGESMDLYAWINNFDAISNDLKEEHLVWLKTVQFGDWNVPSYQQFIQIPMNDHLAHNGSIYLHVRFVRSGNSPYANEKSFDHKSSFHTTYQLNRYMKKKFKNTKNLLTGKTDIAEDLAEKMENASKSGNALSYWHSNLTINLVDDQTNWRKNQVPAMMKDFIKFEMTTGKTYPILWINDYWNLYRDYFLINQTLTSLNLTLNYEPMSLFKWQLYLAQSKQNTWSTMFQSATQEDEELALEGQDSMKLMFLDNNIYVLILTITATLLHTIFEFLAFKNDIQFWRTKKDLKGLSARTLFYNVFQQFIVLLYVLDNDTNSMIKFSIGISLLIELWKLPKVIEIRFLDKDSEEYVTRTFEEFKVILSTQGAPKFKFVFKENYEVSETSDYDKLAFKYLSWALFPLILCYAVYSLFHSEHRGWYSWVLGVIYGFLLTFGFIMMTPQLFINYKMKSVAHLPWRMMTYKALNTFIDDIFAFVIRMPTLYRIGCFRDDIIFFIQLYQRYIYRVDMERTNEFGLTGNQAKSIDKQTDDEPLPELCEKEVDTNEGKESSSESSSEDFVPVGDELIEEINKIDSSEIPNSSEESTVRHREPIGKDEV